MSPGPDCRHSSLQTCGACVDDSELPRGPEMPATRAGQEIFQNLFHESQAENRRLTAENAVVKAENERLKAELAATKRKSRRKK